MRLVRPARVVRILIPGIAIALACGCGGSNPPASPRAQTPPSARPPDAAIEPLAQKTVLVYFPSSTSASLVGQQREIVRTATPGDQAKQILSELIAGPDEGSAGAAAVPAGTRLIQVYVLQNGTAYADFSEELRSAIGGGSDAEILTIYSIVDSITLNVPQIFRVGILVGGQPCESLNGHLDLRRPLPPDRKLLIDVNSTDRAGDHPPPAADV